jgi:hypothetical protein
LNVKVLSAQVILQTASSLGQQASKVNLEALSKKKTAAAINAFFRKFGFETGHYAGNSFSISAEISTFEKVFSIQIVAKGDATFVRWKDGALKDYFPLPNLPKFLEGLVVAVVLPIAPDFGPGNY